MIYSCTVSTLPLSDLMKAMQQSCEVSRSLSELHTVRPYFFGGMYPKADMEPVCLCFGQPTHKLSANINKKTKKQNPIKSWSVSKRFHIVPIACG